MKSKDYLGQFEEIVILAVLRLGEQAYGVTIRQLIEESTERTTSIGAIYATLDRLERKGFVSSRQGETTRERGGRAKRYIRIEGAGVHALSVTNAARNRLTVGLTAVPKPTGA